MSYTHQHGTTIDHSSARLFDPARKTLNTYCGQCKDWFEPVSHANGHSVINRVNTDNHGFLKETDVAMIAADPGTRLTMLLVRCGSGRFLAPAQDVKHFIDLIESTGKDYVRDVSIPAAISKVEAGQ